MKNIFAAEPFDMAFNYERQPTIKTAEKPSEIIEQNETLKNDYFKDDATKSE